MKTALITGGNRSIGLWTARELVREGFHVFIGSRTLQSGEEAVQKLHDEGLTAVEAVQLDVTDADSVAAARVTIGQKTDVLDVLINNAGISGDRPQTATEATIEKFTLVYNVNVLGVVRVTQAFLDLLKKSPAPRIVNVSSSVGSLTLHSDPSWQYYGNKPAVYASSKAAQNMYTIILASELRDTPFKVNAVDPGFTATDFTRYHGTGAVDIAAARVAKLALLGPDGPTGTFVSEENDPEHGLIPW
ncbi:SDR family oxidoreductase [Subtercola lobariae]|uniref:Short-chain dehydrogenase n=2 Tax=Subtercola lobariae TaxID=1588641 RepID=A0A917EZG4_9MICO|nr:SDR family oxidoreductase [Subtercola lobariae]GGF35119.1 short-chain dehydrogenase [Subtercola lobariae]